MAACLSQSVHPRLASFSSFDLQEPWEPPALFTEHGRKSRPLRWRPALRRESGVRCIILFWQAHLSIVLSNFRWMLSILCRGIASLVILHRVAASLVFCKQKSTLQGFSIASHRQWALPCLIDHMSSVFSPISLFSNCQTPQTKKNHKLVKGNLFTFAFAWVALRNCTSHPVVTWATQAWVWRRHTHKLLWSLLVLWALGLVALCCWWYYVNGRSDDVYVGMLHLTTIPCPTNFVTAVFSTLFFFSVKFSGFDAMRGPFSGRGENNDFSLHVFLTWPLHKLCGCWCLAEFTPLTCLSCPTARVDGDAWCSGMSVECKWLMPFGSSDEFVAHRQEAA